MDWRKSSYSGAQGSCVELASDSGAILVRDTTNRDGGTLGFTAEAWTAFLIRRPRRKGLVIRCPICRPGVCEHGLSPVCGQGGFH
jgi:hypothetical protein